MENYNAEEIYKHGDKCIFNGVVYRATCSGAAMQYIAPDKNSIGTFWIVEDEPAIKPYVAPSNAGLIDLE